MNWHTTTRVLILILLAIDLVIGSALYRERRSAAYLPDDMTQEALLNLSEKNITAVGKLDTRIYTETVFSYTAQTAYADTARAEAHTAYSSVLAALSFLTDRSLSFVEENVHYFDTPDGLSLSVADEDQNPLGAAAIAGKTHFEFVCSELSESPLAGVSELTFSQSDDSIPSSVKKGLSAFFDSVYSDTVSFELLSCVRKEDYALARCDITLNGRPIYGMRLYAAVRVRDGKIGALDGDLFFSEPTGAYNASLLDGINILYHLDAAQSAPVSEGATEILSERLFYSFYQYDTGDYYLVPAWEIVCRVDNTESVVCLNALNGKAVS